MCVGYCGVERAAGQAGGDGLAWAQVGGVAQGVAVDERQGISSGQGRLGAEGIGQGLELVEAFGGLAKLAGRGVAQDGGQVREFLGLYAQGGAAGGGELGLEGVEALGRLSEAVRRRELRRLLQFPEA